MGGGGRRRLARAKGADAVLLEDPVAQLHILLDALNVRVRCHEQLLEPCDLPLEFDRVVARARAALARRRRPPPAASEYGVWSGVALTAEGHSRCGATRA